MTLQRLLLHEHISVALASLWRSGRVAPAQSLMQSTQLDRRGEEGELWLKSKSSWITKLSPLGSQPSLLSVWRGEPGPGGWDFECKWLKWDLSEGCAWLSLRDGVRRETSAPLLSKKKQQLQWSGLMTGIPAGYGFLGHIQTGEGDRTLLEDSYLCLALGCLVIPPVGGVGEHCWGQGYGENSA